jgi:hypothetical protein
VAERELKPDERVSVARATKLIRKANKEKADLLNDMQQQGNIAADAELPATTYARNHKGTAGDPKTNKITLNSKKVSLLNGALPLSDNSPEMVTLAGTLLHEVDHAQCHDEMACYGAEVDFYQAINREFDKFFPGTTAAEKGKIEKQKKQMEKEANDQYERIARRGGTGYGTGFKKVFVPMRAPGFDDVAVLPECVKESVMVRVLPDDPATEVTIQLERLALRIYDYFDHKGKFPTSGNAQMVKALRELVPSVFTRDELNTTGEVTDPWGRPYIYKSPGQWYPGDFDLYSLGPCGRDEDGGGENILCELHRR